MARPILTDDLPRYLRELGEEVSDLKRTNFQSVTSGLPAYPQDGQIIFLQTPAMLAAGAAVWQLRYNANSISANKWEFVGGSPMHGIAAGGSTASNVAQTTGMPKFTTQFAGDYICRFQTAYVQNQVNALNQMHLESFVNNVFITLGLHITAIQFGGNSVGMEYEIAVPANTIWETRFRSFTSQSMNISGTTLFVQPIRLG